MRPMTSSYLQLVKEKTETERTSDCVIIEMTKKAWEFMGANRKTLDCV